MENNWISVKDRLPEKKTYVLCWIADVQCVNICKYEYLCNDLPVFSLPFSYVPTVTHWMPLPESPKQTNIF